MGIRIWREKTPNTTATMGDAAAKPPGPGPSHWCDFMRPWSGHAAGSAAPIGHNSPHCWWGHPRALPCKRKQETFDSSAALFGQLAPHCWWNHLLVLPCKRKHSIINTASQCPGAVKSPQANAGWRPPPVQLGGGNGSIGGACMANTRTQEAIPSRRDRCLAAHEACVPKPRERLGVSYPPLRMRSFPGPTRAEDFLALARWRVHARRKQQTPKGSLPTQRGPPYYGAVRTLLLARSA